METFSALLALCAGNSPVTDDIPHKGQWRGALMFSLICAWIKRWVNNREAGDLRRHRAQYDVIVMTPQNVIALGVIHEMVVAVDRPWAISELHYKVADKITDTPNPNSNL